MSGLSVTRGKLLSVVTRGGRALAEVALVSGETRSRVEVLQPFGISGLPNAGADLVVLEIGSRDHLVAMMADDPSLRIPDLAPGEFGINVAGQTIIWRANGLQISGAPRVTIVGTAEIVVDAPVIRLGAGATIPVKLANDTPATKVFGI